MASTDARLFPRKNESYRVTFAIFDADGDGVTSATGLDSEVSKDGGAFADCTNEATEIAQGFYYLDLTSTEMNADTVAVIVKTTSVDAKSTRLVFYPVESGDISGVELADGAITAAKVADNAIDAGAIATDAITEIQNGLMLASSYTTPPTVAQIRTEIDTNSTKLDAAVSTRLASASYTAPDNAGIDTLEGRLTEPRAALLDNLDATISSRSTLTAQQVWEYGTRTLSSFGTLIADIWASVSRTLTAGTNITLAKGTGITGFNDLSAAQVNAEVADVINTDAQAEPASVPAANATLAAKINFIYAWLRNKRTVTSTTATLRNDADNASIGAATVSDDGTTFTHGEWA